MIGFALVATSAAGAAQPLVSDASSGAAELGGPYCGLYAVYAAARLNGLEARENGIEDLLKPEYIGSHAGASPAELRAAAGALGMEARIATGLTRLDLLALSSPAVLHVKANEWSEEADHWVLLASCTPWEAVLIDQDSEPVRESMATLAARWNGLAVIIDREPVTSVVRWPTALVVSLAVAGLVLAPGVLRRITERFARGTLPAGARPRLVDGAVAGVMLFAVALACAGTNRNQPIWNSAAREAIVERHLSQFLPSVSTDELLAMVRGASGDEPYTLLDARYEDDFATGHIPGAASLPVHASDAEVRDFVSGLAPDHRIIIYCQSDRCSFSAILAARLRALGVRRIAIYHDGWAAWSELEGVPHDPEVK